MLERDLERSCRRFSGTTCGTTAREIARKAAPILAFHWNDVRNDGRVPTTERSTHLLGVERWNGGNDSHRADRLPDRLVPMAGMAAEAVGAGGVRCEFDRLRNPSSPSSFTPAMGRWGAASSLGAREFVLDARGGNRTWPIDNLRTVI
jgi:hypothetical protein